jgi:hypothetical protein
MAREHQVSHKQMRILRLRSDELHRKYKALNRTLLKREMEEYLAELSALVDRACKNSGFMSQPVLVDRRKGGIVGLGDINNKGKVQVR